MITDEISKLLGLSPAEKKILEVIRGRPSNMSELSRLIKIPRTTLYTAINTLKSRELISMRKKGKAVIVSPTRSELLENLHLVHSADQKFTFLYGKEAMLKVWEHLASSPARSRISCIQPTKSMISLVGNSKPGEFIPTNELIKENQIIVEAIMREDVFTNYMNLHKDDPKLQKQIIESFIGRMNDTTFVDNRFLNNNSDLLIGIDGAYLMNWQSEVGIKIQDKDMIALLKELFDLARGYGKKIDLNDYMKEQLRMV